MRRTGKTKIDWPKDDFFFLKNKNNTTFANFFTNGAQGYAWNLWKEKEKEEEIKKIIKRKSEEKIVISLCLVGKKKKWKREKEKNIYSFVVLQEKW